MSIKRLILVNLAWLFLAFSADTAAAGEPVPWGIGFQPPASPVMERIIDFHNMLLIIEAAIVLFVLGLLGYIILRFNAKANPTPSKTTHNTLLEVVWTVVPILILVFISVPSMKLLFFMDKTQNPGLTLKVVGHQWFWSYEYPDQGNIEFDSIRIPDDEIKPGQKRLLDVDNRVVLPVNTDIRLLMTSDDVIHNWAVPAFGIKMDTVPGRLNETWVRITKPGTYYGQCSELCGIDHGYMPVVVEAVSKADFAKWVVTAKKKFAAAEPAAGIEVAGREPTDRAGRVGQPGASARKER